MRFVIALSLGLAATAAACYPADPPLFRNWDWRFVPLVLAGYALPFILGPLVGSWLHEYRHTLGEPPAGILGGGDVISRVESIVFPVAFAAYGGIALVASVAWIGAKMAASWNTVSAENQPNVRRYRLSGMLGGILLMFLCMVGGIVMRFSWGQVWP